MRSAAKLIPARYERHFCRLRAGYVCALSPSASVHILGLETATVFHQSRSEALSIADAPRPEILVSASACVLKINFALPAEIETRTRDELADALASCAIDRIDLPHCDPPFPAVVELVIQTRLDVPIREVALVAETAPNTPTDVIAQGLGELSAVTQAYEELRLSFATSVRVPMRRLLALDQNLDHIDQAIGSKLPPRLECDGMTTVMCPAIPL